MPTTTVKCESWCVDHASDGGETCGTAPVFFGPEIPFGPRFGGMGPAGELFAYRLDEESTRVSIFAHGGGRDATPVDVATLRHIHAALQLDADGFAKAVATMVEVLDS